MHARVIYSRPAVGFGELSVGDKTLRCINAMQYYDTAPL